MALTPCPYCGAEIDNDSYFCDQCAAELYICPQCRVFRKGKFCPADGKTPVKASQLASGDVAGVAPASGPVAGGATPPVSAPVSTPATPVGTPSPVATTGPQGYGQAAEPQNLGTPRPTTTPPAEGPAAPGPTRLVCRQLGIVLPLQNGAILGRKVGQYVPQLAQCQYLSGTHARLDFAGGVWTVTDQKSTNGTMVNGIPCAPFVAVPVKLGDIVRFATVYDFYVE